MTSRGPFRDPDSKVGRIAAFYADNPGELLTWSDFMTKFGVDDKRNARELVKYVRERRGVNLRVVSVVMLADGPPTEEDK